MTAAQILFIFLGALGIWLIIMQAFSLFGKISSKQKTDAFTLHVQSVERAAHGESVEELTFLERMARTFSNLTKRKNSDDADLSTKLLRAGLPYFSPQHYYSRQISYTVLLASMGILIGSFLSLMLNMPYYIVIIIAFILGVWGSTFPAQEVKKKTKERVNGLILDMTYHLARLRMQFDRWGQIRPAIDRVVATAPKEVTFSKSELELIEKKRDSIPQEIAINLSLYLSGIGGNLFAELLNRFTMELSRGVSPEDAAERMKQHFEPNFDMDLFLKTIVAGINGEPIGERLREIDNRLHRELSKRIKFAGAKAETTITLVSAFTLLPLFIVVGVPMLLMASQFFGG
jgi:uncharacterized protein YpmB